MIARVDVVVTTRLHGLVLALKNGVPAVAVDPIRGGAKVCRQAEALGWPHAFAVDAATPAALQEALATVPATRGRGAASAARGPRAGAPGRSRPRGVPRRDRAHPAAL